MKEHLVQWLGNIPSEWRETRLLTLCSQTKTSNSSLQEKNLLSLSYGKIIRKDITTAAGLLPESFEGYNIVRENDIVLRFTDLQNDQRSLRVGLVTETGIITSAYCAIRPCSVVDPKYLYYALHTFDLLKGFYNMGSGVRQSLSWEEAKRIHIPLPSRAEQIEIVATLDPLLEKIDRAIELLVQELETLEQLKKSIIYETVTKGLDPTVPMKPSGDTSIGDIPKHWNYTPLNYLFRIVGGNAFSLELQGSNVGDLPFFKNSDVNSGVNVVSEAANYVSLKVAQDEGFNVIPPKTILMGKIGESMKKNRRVLNSVACCIDNNMQGMVPLAGAIVPEYAVYAVQLLDANDFNKGGPVPSIDNVKWKRARIPHPRYQEQLRIATVLDANTTKMDKAMKLLRQKLQTLEKLKASLIFEYVTGKRRVSEVS